MDNILLTKIFFTANIISYITDGAAMLQHTLLSVKTYLEFFLICFFPGSTGKTRFPQ